MHAQISIQIPIPNTVTPQAIMTGGCGNIWIWPLLMENVLHGYCVVPTNGTDQPEAPIVFTIWVHHGVAQWLPWSSAVVMDIRG